MIPIAALALAVATAAQPPRSLSLVVWGDLHGDPSPNLFSWVDSLRRVADGHHQPFLAVDAGDSFFGSDLAFATAGASQAAALNLVQPDAITLGAHDFWWNRGRLDTLLTSLKFPVATSNILDALTDKPYGGKSWVMWDFDGLRVGLIGVSDPDLDAAARPTKAYDLRANDPTENVRSAVEELTSRKAELVIVLSHAGIEVDHALAESVPGIHLVVGARDEASQPGQQVGSTWFVRSATGSTRLTRIDLTLTDSGLSAVEMVQTPPAGIALPKAWKPLFDSLSEIATSRANAVLDTLKEAWPKTTHEGYLGNFLADALRMEAKADIGLWPASSLRSGLAKGRVTAGDLWKTIPPPEQVSVFELPGSDVQRLLLYQMTKAKDFLFLSGASCTPDSSSSGGSPTQVSVDGKPIQSSTRYRIAIPMAIRQRLYDLTGFSIESADPTYLERWDRDLIEKYIREHGLQSSLKRVPAMYGIRR